MYFKLPINTDLSNISYAFCEEIDGYYYIVLNDGLVSDTWEEISFETIYTLFPDHFNYEEPESFAPSQLDRIELAIEKSNAELRQEGADALTEELIESGVL